MQLGMLRFLPSQKEVAEIYLVRAGSHRSCTSRPYNLPGTVSRIDPGNGPSFLISCFILISRLDKDIGGNVRENLAKASGEIGGNEREHSLPASVWFSSSLDMQSLTLPFNGSFHQP